MVEQRWIESLRCELENPPTVKDRFSNSHRELSLQRCSTNCPGQILQFTPKTFVPALLDQLSRTNSPIHTEDFRSNAAPPTVKDRFSNSHRELSLQRCSTNCPGQILQFTPKTFVPALLDQLSRTGSPIHTENFRSSAATSTVKNKFSNSHRRLSFQRCSTNCQGQVLQFAPKTFVPALLHQLSSTSSLIHTEDFRSSAAPPTTGSPIHTADFRSSVAPPTVKDRSFQFTPKTFAPALLHQRQVLQFTPKTFAPALLHQGQVLQFTPKTFVPALLKQLSKTSSPIHTEDFRSNAAPPPVKDRFSNFTSKTFVPALLHQLSRTGSPIHTEDFRSNAAPTTCQGQVLQFTPKTFVPALLHQLSRTASPIHTEHIRSSAAPPTVKDKFSNSHRRLSFQRCSTNCQGRDP